MWLSKTTSFEDCLVAGYLLSMCRAQGLSSGPKRKISNLLVIILKRVFKNLNHQRQFMKLYEQEQQINDPCKDQKKLINHLLFTRLSF